MPTPTDCIEVIREFSRYLSDLKKNAGFYPGISKTSGDIIGQWGEKSMKGNPAVSGDCFFFQGSEKSPVYIVDSLGRFFEGKTGELLVKILGAMTLSKDQVFICNADNLPMLSQKIKKNNPMVVIAMGSKAGKALLGKSLPLDTFRGRFFDYQGVRVMPTYHPALLVKDPSYKRQVWEDMKQVMAFAGLAS
jgi:DNA polymerase